MNSTTQLPQKQTNAAKDEQNITLHKTLSFGLGKDTKNSARLNENSLSQKPKLNQQTSTSNMSTTAGQQTGNSESREFGREINTNNAATVILSAPTSAVRKGKASQCNNQAPDAKARHLINLNNKVSLFAFSYQTHKIHSQTVYLPSLVQTIRPV